MKKIILLIFLPLLISFYTYSQDKPSIWMELEFSKKIVKDLKFQFNPEIRLMDAFDMDSTSGFTMDSYILEGGLSYKIFKYLSFESYYRFEEQYDAKYKRKVDENGVKIKPKQYEYVYSNNSSNRLAFDLKSDFDVQRFNFQFRLRYTQGLYANNDASEFRYRAKVEYNIKGIKLAPFANIEFFHDNSVLTSERDSISGGFKRIDKIRTTVGASYAINKNNDIDLFYRIQTNRVKDENANIIGIGYSHNF